MGRNIALIVCLIAAFAWAWTAERTPDPRPANAPAGEFSSGRAMADVEVIAKAPHPIGSPANAAARDYLVGRMTALGLSPQVQRAEVLRQRDNWIAGGMVENIIGVLPGKDRTAPAVALMAHYDSVPGSPGAADDAAGTSAALEIIRALKTKGQPARDVIVLLTDGEESGLLGAQAFFDQHPLAGRVGFLLNMEARGGGGRAQMFQTGAGNGETVELFRKVTASPTASSLTVFLYEHMPNDTDFSVSKAKGVPGLNYAFIGSQFDYHSPTSTPANLDKGSLQHLGEQALAATSEAAFATAVPAKTPNLVYASGLGGPVIAYPPMVGWLLLALTSLLIGIGLVRARRAEALQWTDLLKGSGGALYGALLAAALFRLARHATGAGFGFLQQRYLLAQVQRWEVALALLGVGVLAMAAAASGRGRTRLAGALLALGVGLASSAFGAFDMIGAVLGALAALLAIASFGRPAGVAGSWAGVLILGAIIATALQALAPPTAFLVAWPLALAALAAALTGLAARRNLPGLIVLTLAGTVAVAWLLGFAHGVFEGLDQPEMLGVFVLLASLAIWPLAQPPVDQKGARLAAMAVVLLGVIAVGVVRFDPPWSARHPQATHIAYYVEPAGGRALRISDAPAPPAWTRAVLSADGGQIEQLRLPALRRSDVWAAKAAPITATPVKSELIAQPDGAHGLRLTPPPGARTLIIALKSESGLTGASINGRPVKLAPGKDATRIFWEAPSGQPVTVSFRAAAPGAVEAHYAALIDQWPAEAKPLPARPADLMIFGASGATIVGGAQRFTW